MNMSSLVDLAGTGATWVLYLLIGLSAFQLALMIERGIVFGRSAAPTSLKRRVRDALGTGNLKAVGMTVAGDRSLEARVVAAGLGAADRGVEAADEIMHSALVEEKLELERGLSFLGTLGNNAPFLGLFGTVLGIIHAFADLSASGSGQASRAVMSGISEALISTAVGLIVALPAVAAFNVFQRSIKKRSAAAEALGGELIAHMKSPSLTVRKAA
jgi:biopolymer transport protein ExbB